MPDKLIKDMQIGDVGYIRAIDLDISGDMRGWVHRGLSYASEPMQEYSLKVTMRDGNLNVEDVQSLHTFYLAQGLRTEPHVDERFVLPVKFGDSDKLEFPIETK